MPATLGAEKAMTVRDIEGEIKRLKAERNAASKR
jgi:hypothetical protein